MAFEEKTQAIAVIALANRKAAEDLLGTVYQQDALDIIGKGQGVNKTVTEIHGITVTEDFGINSELFLHWQVPRICDYSNVPNLHLEFAPVTAESGKTSSLQVNISPQGFGTNIGDTGTVFNIVDFAIPSTALESFSVNLELPANFVVEGVEDLHIRVRRIASSNDLIGDIALHHASIEYQRHQR